MFSQTPHPSGYLLRMSKEKIQPSSDAPDSGASPPKSSIDSDEMDRAELIDPILEKKLLRKLDFSMLPLFTLICEWKGLVSLL